MSNRLDLTVTHWLTHMWDRSPLLDASMVVVAKWTPMLMLALIALSSIGYGLSLGQQSAVQTSALLAVVSAVLGRIGNEPIARIVNRARPFETSGFQPLLGHHAGQAFPSNHATGAFALAVSMVHVPGYFGVLLVLAMLLCLARVYNGLHHFTDVIAGALHGSLVACVVMWAFHGLW
jgi:undecaprenyl-diphosphatase